MDNTKSNTSDEERLIDYVPETKVFGICDFCGYDAEAAVKYQMKQHGEKLSEEEYEDEVAFYLFESHPDFCPEMAKMVEEFDNN